MRAQGMSFGGAVSRLRTGGSVLTMVLMTLAVLTTSQAFPLASGALAYSNSTDLHNFPNPFVVNNTFNTSMVVALSQPHAPAGSASTIDVVGTVAVAGSLGRAASHGGLPLPRLDTEAATSNGTAVTAVTQPGNIMTFGGPGVNWVTRYYNNLPGPLGFPIRIVSGMGLCTTDPTGNPVHCYRRQGAFYQGTQVIDYGYVVILRDGSAGRFVLAIAGLSGYATWAEAELVAVQAWPTLSGTGTIARLVDFQGDGIFDTYQVVDGTGDFRAMYSPSTFPYPNRVAETFAIGDSIPHGVVAAASTIDAVGAIPLAVREARAHYGVIWADIDFHLATADGSAILSGVGDLVSVGGPGVNLVTYYYNANNLLPIRLVSGSGLTADGSTFYRRQGNYSQGTAVVDYGYRAGATDPTGRHVMVEAGLSGDATRGMTIASAQDAGTINTGTGTIVALTDNQGDGRYESFQVVAGTGGASLMASPAPFPGL